MSVILGSGEHRYRVVENWAKLPDGWEFRDVAADDRVTTIIGNDRACRLAVGREPLRVGAVGRDDPVALWHCVFLFRDERRI